MAEITKPNKKNVVTGTKYADDIDLSGYDKGVTINAGNGDDVIRGTKLNDKITGGKGNNTVYFSQDSGNDTVILTKGETLNIEYDATIRTFEKSGNDIKIRVFDNNYNSSDSSSVTIKNYAVKNSGAKVNLRDNNFDLELDEWLKTNNVVIENPKGGKIVDTRFNDYIYGSDKNDTIYTTAGDDTIKVGGGNDKIYVKGAGEKTIDFSDVHGGRKIVYGVGTKGAVVNLVINSDEWMFALARYDNDLRCYKIPDSWEDFDEKKELANSITIKDYFKYKEQPNLKMNGVDFSMTGRFGSLDETDSETWLGSFCNEEYRNGTGRAKIYTGSGNDKIIAGKNNDKVYINGSGNKTLIFSSGDGNDIVYGANTKDAKTSLLFSEYDGRTFTRKGNDLVITSLYNSNNVKPNKDTVTISGYFKNLDSFKNINIGNVNSEDIDYVDDIDGWYQEISNKIVREDLYTFLDENKTISYGKENNNKSQTLKGTQLSEKFLGGKKSDKIYTYAGNDEVTAAKGNDIIYLNGAGEKTVNFVKGDGNDTIYMNYDGVKANLVFSDVNTNENSYDEEKGYLIYNRKGNDLVLIRDYGDKRTEKKTVVKNYFNNKTNSELSINGVKLDPTSVTFEYEGSYSKSNKIKFDDNYNYEVYGGKKNDTITLGDGNHSIYSGGGNDKVSLGSGNNNIIYSSGKDVYKSGYGNDNYEIENFTSKSDLYIEDLGGNDTITFCDKDMDDVVFIFDVSKNGNKQMGDLFI